MTTFKSVAIAAGLVTPVFGQAATSSVVGYETVSIAANDFSYIGLRLGTNIEVSGSFSGSTVNSLTDSSADFSGLVDTATYTVTLTSGALSGTIIEAPGSAFSGGVLSGLTGISPAYQADYEVRVTPTLGTLFGVDNSAGLQEGDVTTADIVWIPNGEGGFDQHFFATPNPPFVAGGWTLIGGGPSADEPIVYADGMIIQRRGATDVELIVSGDLITDNVSSPVSTGFNFISSLFPAGSTLGNSGLQTFVQPGDVNSADVVWLTVEDASGNSSLQRFFFATPNPPFVAGGWTQIGVDGDMTNTPMSSGFILQRRGASADLMLNPPDFYAGL